MNRRSEKAAPSLLQLNLFPNLVVYSCIANENQLTVTFVKEEKFDSRGQTVLRKQQIVCTGTEIEAFKKTTFRFWSIFNCTMSLEEKMRKLKLTPLTMPKRAVPVLMTLNDKSFPAEIRQRFEKNNVQSIVFRDKTDRVNLNYTITFISDNQNSQFVSYEIYIMK